MQLVGCFRFFAFVLAKVCLLCVCFRSVLSSTEVQLFFLVQYTMRTVLSRSRRSGERGMAVVACVCAVCRARRESTSGALLARESFLEFAKKKSGKTTSATVRRRAVRRIEVGRLLNGSN